MEPWSFKNFRQPFLDIEDLYLEGHTPVLVSGSAAFALEGIGERDGAAEVADLLDRLRDPRSAEWQRADEHADLLQALDDLALINDAHRDADVDEEMQRAASMVEEVAEHVRARNGSVAAVAARLRSSIEPMIDGSGAPRTVERDFFLRTLLIESRYWRMAAPHVLICEAEVLRRLDGGSGPSWLPRLRNLPSGLYSDRDLRSALTSVASMLSWAGTAGAETALQAPPVARESLSGAAFAVVAERAAMEAVQVLGPTRFDDITALPDFDPRIGVGSFIEEFHVTCRFVEILLPVMMKRLDDPIRRRMFRYYSEEFGHEQFELETCLSLGLDEQALRHSIPLPLHLAFVDAFTLAASEDPLGYLISIFVTEGLISAPTAVAGRMRSNRLLDEQFKAVSGRHERLNIDLNHAALSRHMLQSIRHVPPAAQERAHDTLLYLVELNHRLWNHLVDFYSGTSGFHGWLGRTERSL